MKYNKFGKFFKPNLSGFENVEETRGFGLSYWNINTYFGEHEDMDIFFIKNISQPETDSYMFTYYS